ncbi:MAG TPA: CapA family protein, partial [Gemmatimonadales bacterium]
MGNFEGVLGDSGTTYKCGPEGKRVGGSVPDTAETPKPDPRRKKAKPPVRRLCYAFLTPTSLAPRLLEAGFTHLNLANNHASDFGADARLTTEATFDTLGLGHYGPLGSIAIDSVRRGDSVTAVALVGFTTYPYAYDLLDIARSAAVVDSVRQLADLVVVTFHGGAEGATALHVPETAESLAGEPRGD